MKIRNYKKTFLILNNKYNNIKNKENNNQNNYNNKKRRFIKFKNNKANWS